MAFPWRFFKLNSQFYNTKLKIFSKLDMDKRLPEQWKLTQYIDDGTVQPAHFPVFVKPEWGQNSKGVVRIDCSGSRLSISNFENIFSFVL
jgi:hypothetical protein